MEKSRDAFRTISEVAELLDTPAHVLRFWESRFPQIRPVKRAGGRRYYRPSDVALLSGIKRLLHGDGLTIRGVQKVLRENGIRHVMALAEGPIAEDALEITLAEADQPPAAEILPFPEPPPGREAPDMPALPLWSAAPRQQEDPAPPAHRAEPTPDSRPHLPLARDTASGPDGPPDATPKPPRAAEPQPPVQAVADAALPDEDMAPDDPGLAGAIAARLRLLDAAAVRDQRTALVAAALRLRDLRSRLAAAAGAGGP